MSLQAAPSLEKICASDQICSESCFGDPSSKLATKRGPCGQYWKWLARNSDRYVSLSEGAWRTDCRTCSLVAMRYVCLLGGLHKPAKPFWLYR